MALVFGMAATNMIDAIMIINTINMSMQNFGSI